MANKVFKKRKAGAEGSDCTARYAVKMMKEATVREFIEAVIENKNEWGYIMVMTEAGIWSSPRTEYRNGQQLDNNLEQYMDKTITKASASGGWSRMDYILYV